MRATLTTKSGATIELDGSESEIAQVIALAAGGVGSTGAAPARRGRPPGSTNGNGHGAVAARRASRPVSPARKKAMQLQGAYMGIVRGLPAKQKAQVKALTKDKGVAAGLQLAKKLAGGKN